MATSSRGATGRRGADRRVQPGLRQEDLADLAGVSERFVYALENDNGPSSWTR